MLLTRTETSLDFQALVDRDGKLSGNWSASDVRGIYQEKLPAFLEDAQSYLQTYSPKSLTPVVVRGETTLLSAVTTLVENQLHRVYIIDDNYRPVGVLALSDVIRLVMNFEYTTAVH